jgi:hypothetical protein
MLVFVVISVLEALLAARVRHQLNTAALLVPLFAQASLANLIPPRAADSAPWATVGTSVALRGELAGTVVADEIRPFTFRVNNDGEIILNGTLQDRVVRRHSTGTLDFYYRIQHSRESAEPISAVARDVFHGPFLLTDVDWRVDGLGSVAPSSAFQTLETGRITTEFATYIMPGQSSRFVFIGTNATAFAPEGKIYLGVPSTSSWRRVFGTFTPLA